MPNLGAQTNVAESGDIGWGEASGLVVAHSEDGWGEEEVNARCDIWCVNVVISVLD